jgi:hypothetical protein
MVCRGICGKYKAKWEFNQLRYATGQKRCNSCGIFIEWSGVWCPCCRKYLRNKPRTSKYKKLYNEKIKIIEKISE